MAATNQGVGSSNLSGRANYKIANQRGREFEYFQARALRTSTAVRYLLNRFKVGSLNLKHQRFLPLPVMYSFTTFFVDPEQASADDRLVATISQVLRQSTRYRRLVTYRASA
jgi:hypothetical protein